MEIKNYKDLKVWQKSRELVKAVYLISRQFPEDERFGLTTQIRRAVISVPSNIAEGHSRSGSQDYYRFLSIALVSLSEVETQLIISVDLDFCDSKTITQATSLIDELQRMLHSLRKSLKPNP